MPSQSSGPYRPTSASANSPRISGESPHPGLLPHLSHRCIVGPFTLVDVSPKFQHALKLRFRAVVDGGPPQEGLIRAGASTFLVR